MGSVARMTIPYRAAMKLDWDGFEAYYMEHNEAVSFPLTVTNDNAFHIAVHSGKVELLKDLLETTIPFAYTAKNTYGNTALHEAASTGQVKMAELLLDYDTDGQIGLVDIENESGETPFFTAAAFGRTKMVEFLHSKLTNPCLRRDDSTSILHIAVLGNYFDTALTLLEKDESLGTLVDENGMTCLQLLANMPSAFNSGNPMGIFKRLLYFCLPDDDYEADGDDDKKANKTPAPSIQSEDLESGHGRICFGQSSYLNILKAISGIYYAIWWGLASEFPAIKKLWSKKVQQKKVLKLATKLAENDLTWRDLGKSPGENIGLVGPHMNQPESFSLFVKFPGENIRPDMNPAGQIFSRSQTRSTTEIPLIAAARHGIIEIVRAILKVYPQAIEYVNEKNENIFHVAARYRRKEIFDLLQSSHIPTSRLMMKINDEGDSILHQAAYLGETQLRDRPGDALRMQSEIQWFKRVKKIVPTYFINHRNHKAMTAQELFTNAHKNLVEDGREWLGRTTQACTIVAVLIATVAFTSAYTVPGGSSKTGRPLLLDRVPFRVFAISDTISLCFALTSVVVFLSIMTSRMHEQDFRMSLPLKVVLGLTTLFFAVAAMMVAFSATLILMIRQRLHWAAIPIYTIACYPVTIFLALQFPLYLNIAWFTVRDIVYTVIESLPRPKFMTK